MSFAGWIINFAMIYYTTLYARFDFFKLFWGYYITDFEWFKILVLMEHIIIGIKILIDLLLPDIPESVLIARRIKRFYRERFLQKSIEYPT